MEDIRINLENLNDKERKQFIALIERANKPRNKVWKPKDSEIYWSVWGFGDVFSRTWDGMNDDEGYWLMGNCFRTREEAEFYKEKLLVTAELQRFANEYNEEIDWENTLTKKWRIYYNFIERKILFSDWFSSKFSDICFSSRELCEQAIETIGEDRIKKYYFGVEE